MKILEMLLKSFLAILLLIIVVWMIAIGLLQTEKGQEWVLGQIVSRIEQKTNAHVSVSRVELISPFRMRIHDLTYQHESVVVRILQLDLSCTSPRLLLEGKIVCSDLHARDVFVDGSIQSSSEKTSLIDWEKPFPVYVKIENLFIEGLRIAEPLVNSSVDQPELAAFLKNSNFHIQGYINNNPRKSAIAAHLLVKTREPYDIKLALDTQNQELSLSLHGTHFPLDIFDPIQLANTYCDVAWSASASIPVWQNLLDGIENHEPIDGNFKGLISTSQNDTLLATLAANGMNIKGKYRLYSKNFLQIEDSKIESSDFCLQSQFKLLANQTFEQAQFHLNVLQLDPFRKWFSVPAQGTIQAQGHLSGTLQIPILDIEIYSPFLQIHDNAFKEVSALIAGTIQSGFFHGDIECDSGHWKNGESFGELIHAQLSGYLNPHSFQGDIHLYGALLKNHDFTIHDFRSFLTGAISSQAFQGDIQLQTALFNTSLFSMEDVDTYISGHLSQDGFTGQLEARSDTIQVQNQLLHGVHAKWQGTFSDKMAQGDLVADLDYERESYTLKTALQWKKKQLLEFAPIHWHGLNSDVEGKLALSLHDWLCTGWLECRAIDLKLLSNLASLDPIEGDASFRLDFTPTENGEQDVKGNLFAQHVHSSEWRMEKLSLQAYWADLWSKKGVVISELEMDQFSSARYGARRFLMKSQQELNWKDHLVSQVDAKIRGEGVRWDDLQAEALDLALFLPDSLNPIPEKVDFVMHKFKYPNGEFELLSAKTEMDPKQTSWPFLLAFESNMKEKFQFRSSGHWHVDHDVKEVTFDYGDGHLGAYPIALLNPFKVSQKPESFHLEPVHFRLGNGEFEAKIDLENNQLQSELKGSQVPSELLHFIFPELPITGTVSFSGYLEGPLEEPQGQLQVNLHQIQVTEEIFSSHPLINGYLSLNLSQRQLQLASVLNGIGKSPVHVQGTLPIAIRLDAPQLIVHEEFPMDLAITAEGEIDPFMNLFYNDITNLSGQAKIALSMRGNIKSPEIQGSIDLHEGSYESLSTGAIYHHINAHIEGNGSSLLLKTLSAQDTKQGSITASGIVHLDKRQQFPFDFEIKPKKIFILDSDYASASASGTLQFTGNQKHSRLQGTLIADEAAIRMEEALPTQVKTVDVKYVNLPHGEKPPHDQSHESGWPIQLDVKVEFPDNIAIEGKNLKSLWKGTVTIAGMDNNPLINGELRVTSGEYNFNGKVFRLTQGNIHFSSSTDKKTTIYAVASKEIDRIMAEIIVKGPTNKLAVSFRSNPPLSQREVLSYILFGRGISDITPDQGDVLSQSFTELNSNSGEGKAHTDFLSRLRNNMGIDRLDITSSDSENQDMSLQIGKYVSKGIFVSVNKSINAGYDRVAIEADIRKNVKAQAELGVGDSAQGKILLKWKKDY